MTFGARQLSLGARRVRVVGQAVDPGTEPRAAAAPASAPAAATAQRASAAGPEGAAALPEAAPAGRRLIVLAALLVQVALGASQVWSVFRDPLVALTGWSVSEVTLAYSLNLFVSGIASWLGGVWIRRIGPRRLVLIAGVLFGLGVGLAGLAEGRLWLLYLTYGVVGGIGRGAGAVVAPATLVSWFPERRGLMAGLAGAGIGVGTLLIAPLAGALVEAAGVLATFAVLGLAALVAIVAAAPALKSPPAGWRPPGWQPESGRREARSRSLRGALRTRALYGLWALLLLCAMGGLALLSQASPLAQELVGADPHLGASLVGIIAVAAVAGQLGFGWLSDSLGRRQVFVAMLLVQGAALLLLPRATSLAAFVVLLVAVLFCLGGALGTMPAVAADYFGTRDLGAILGFLMTALGVAAVVGPVLIAMIREQTGAYDLALAGLGVLAAASVPLPLALRPPGSRRRRVRIVPLRVPSRA